MLRLREWEAIYGACMLLFNAIHFMTWKHCKHDGEQHHYSNIFLTEFYEIRNFIYAHVSCFCTKW